MRTIRILSSLRRASRLMQGVLTLAACGLAGTIAHAHLTYSGRDLGAFSGLANDSRAITNQAVTGNYGWADAADGVLGDTHRGRAFRVHLDNAALVTLNVTANPAATTNSLGGFIPAFSIYSGLAGIAPFPPSQTTNVPSADHDGDAASLAWRIWWVQQNLDSNATTEAPTDGCWNALGDWKIGGDGDLPGDFSQLSSFTYRGSAAAADRANTVTGSFVLPAGDYTILIGGNDLANKTSDTALSPHGIAVTFTVAPMPTLSIATKVLVGVPVGSATNWKLETTTTLNAGNWTTVTNAPVIVDGQPGVVLDPGALRQYFRLNYLP